MESKIIMIGNEEVTVYKARNDNNGNPRYIVSWLSFARLLGVDSYESTHASLRGTGWKAYRGRDFGGGFVLTSYNIAADLKRLVK